MSSTEPGEDHPDASRTGAQAVERAIALLRCFDGNPGTISLTELAGRTRLRTSTAHRIVRALVRGELLEQDPMTERYRLGRAFAILGQAALRGFAFDAARPDLEQLAEMTGESASLGLRDAADVIVVLHADCDQPLRFGQPPGTRLRIHASAMGKAILAFADADLRTTVAGLESLPKYTASTITKRTQLTGELQKIRELGYSINLEERYAGVSGVAAPVLDGQGRARAAIGIRGPAVRLDARRIREVAPHVMATASRIASYLPLERL